jgi:hypothetical protein
MIASKRREMVKDFWIELIHAGAIADDQGGF